MARPSNQTSRIYASLRFQVISWLHDMPLSEGNHSPTTHHLLFFSCREFSLLDSFTRRRLQGRNISTQGVCTFLSRVGLQKDEDSGWAISLLILHVCFQSVRMICSPTRPCASRTKNCISNIIRNTISFLLQTSISCVQRVPNSSPDFGPFAPPYAHAPRAGGVRAIQRNET